MIELRAESDHLPVCVHLAVNATETDIDRGARGSNGLGISKKTVTWKEDRRQEFEGGYS